MENGRKNPGKYVVKPQLEDLNVKMFLTSLARQFQESSRHGNILANCGYSCVVVWEYLFCCSVNK